MRKDRENTLVIPSDGLNLYIFLNKPRVRIKRREQYNFYTWTSLSTFVFPIQKPVLYKPSDDPDLILWMGRWADKKCSTTLEFLQS